MQYINKIQKNKAKIRKQLLSLECLKDNYDFTPVFLCYEYTQQVAPLKAILS